MAATQADTSTALDLDDEPWETLIALHRDETGTARLRQWCPITGELLNEFTVARGDRITLNVTYDNACNEGVIPHER